MANHLAVLLQPISRLEAFTTIFVATHKFGQFGRPHLLDPCGLACDVVVDQPLRKMNIQVIWNIYQACLMPKKAFQHLPSTEKRASTGTFHGRCDNGQGVCHLGLVRKILSVAPSRTEKHVSLALDFADSDYNHDLHT